MFDTIKIFIKEYKKNLDSWINDYKTLGEWFQFFKEIFWCEMMGCLSFGLLLGFFLERKFESNLEFWITLTTVIFLGVTLVVFNFVLRKFLANFSNNLKLTEQIRQTIITKYNLPFKNFIPDFVILKEFFDENKKSETERTLY